MPMAEAVLRNFGVLRINEIDGIMRIRPGINEILPGKNLADIFGRARVVDNRVAVLSKTDANHEMPIRSGSFAAQPVVTE